MKLDTYVPFVPVVDDRIGDGPRHSFEVGARDVVAIETADGGVVVTVRRDRGNVRIFFSPSGGYGAITNEVRK